MLHYSDILGLSKTIRTRYRKKTRINGLKKSYVFTGFVCHLGSTLKKLHSWHFYMFETRKKWKILKKEKDLVLKEKYLKNLNILY